MLHDDRNVRFEHRGVVGVARDRLRVVEIVEAQVQRASGGDGHAVGADRLPVGEEDGDGNARVLLAGVEDAGGLVGDECAVGKRAFGGNVALRDCPSPPGARCTCASMISTTRSRSHATPTTPRCSNRTFRSSCSTRGSIPAAPKCRCCRPLPMRKVNPDVGNFWSNFRFLGEGQLRNFAHDNTLRSESVLVESKI